ncbi:RHS repeat-associated core domain-containing protein [Thiolapillus sp.]|uniref:RHS repeat-associated core domain-containing protein n=1 Tax=Thiolapillus sp. TaxID=2017437 RepID=UPI003AF6DEA4
MKIAAPKALTAVKALAVHGTTAAVFSLGSYLLYHSVQHSDTFIGKPVVGEVVALDNRSYSPKLSRFLTIDRKSQFMSAYTYTSGNPMTFADPSGEGIGDGIARLVAFVSAKLGTTGSREAMLTMEDIVGLSAGADRAAMTAAEGFGTISRNAAGMFENPSFVFTVESEAGAGAATQMAAETSEQSLLGFGVAEEIEMGSISSRSSAELLTNDMGIYAEIGLEDTAADVRGRLAFNTIENPLYEEPYIPSTAMAVQEGITVDAVSAVAALGTPVTFESPSTSLSVFAMGEGPGVSAVANEAAPAVSLAVASADPLPLLNAEGQANIQQLVTNMMKNGGLPGAGAKPPSVWHSVASFAGLSLAFVVAPIAIEQIIRAAREHHAPSDLYRHARTYQ